MLLHHKELNRYHEVPDEDAAAVLADSGWEPADEPVQANPALAPGEVETKPTKSRKTDDTKAAPAD